MANPLHVQVGGSHYKTMAIQPVEFIMANDIPYMEGNVIKYVSRWKTKNGLDDLRKARHYLDLLIDNEEKHYDTESYYGEPRPETIVYSSTPIATKGHTR